MQMNLTSEESSIDEIELPNGIRVLSVIFGVVLIILAFVIMAYPGLAVATLVLILTISLFVSGSERIAFGVGATDLSGGFRALNVVVGILEFILAFVFLAWPAIAVGIKVALFALSLLIGGIATAAIGGTAKPLPGGRGIRILLGILMIGFAIIVIAQPKLAVSTLIFLLSFGFMLDGMHSIAIGLTGKK